MAKREDNTAGGAPAKTIGDNDGRLVELLDPEVLGEVTIELVASLGRGTMSLAALASLAEGATIELDTPLNGSVDLSLNDRLVARGELVSVGDRFGVRITEIFARKR